MLEFNIKLVDTVFKINCNYSYFYELAKNYLTNDKEDIVINVSETDINYENEQRNSFFECRNISVNPVSKQRLESTSIERKIAYYFMDKDVYFIHGAVVAKDNEAYMFIAPSGTGKTTHISLWLKQYSDAYPVNGDVPLVIIKDNKVYVSGSPWSGTERLETNVTVPLKAICLLERSDINKITKLDDTDIKFKKIYGHILRKDDNVLGIIKNIKTIIENVDFYSLECNMEIEAAKVAYEGMK